MCNFAAQEYEKGGSSIQRLASSATAIFRNKTASYAMDALDEIASRQTI